MPNSSKSINFIGVGKLGSALVNDIHTLSLGFIKSICNSTLNSSQLSANAFSTATASSSIKQLPSASITFITTPDDLIAPCAAQLIHNENLLPGSVVVHCSGVLSSDVLAVLKDKGCFVASLHPMRSFSKAPDTSFKEAYCALEGCDEAIHVIKSLLRPLKLTYLDICNQHKASYHSGGVFSANYLIAILYQAQMAYQRSGIEEQLALTVACDLAQSVLTNIKKTHSLKKALTGPLARGDDKTLLHHLTVLPDKSKKLYQNLAQSLLPLCDLSEETLQKIQTLLACEF